MIYLTSSIRMMVLKQIVNIICVKQHKRHRPCDVALPDTTTFHGEGFKFGQQARFVAPSPGPIKSCSTD